MGFVVAGGAGCCGKSLVAVPMGPPPDELLAPVEGGAAGGVTAGGCVEVPSAVVVVVAGVGCGAVLDEVPPVATPVEPPLGPSMSSRKRSCSDG